MDSTYPDISVSGDDWRNINDRRERKKAQDRLAKRLSRQRKRELPNRASSLVDEARPSSSVQASGSVEPPRQPDAASITPPAPWTSHDKEAEVSAPLLQPVEERPSPEEVLPDVARRSQDPTCWVLELQARRLHINPDAVYMVLGAQTVIAALTANAQSIPVYCNVFVPKVLTSSSIHNPPSALMPTVLQSEIPHLAFVAALPFAGLRDAILRALPHIDYQDLWRDSVSGGFFVWGKTPWLPQGWEVTEDWAQKWWFLLDREVVETANFWRLQRGLTKLRRLN